MDMGLGAMQAMPDTRGQQSEFAYSIVCTASIFFSSSVLFCHALCPCNFDSPCITAKSNISRRDFTGGGNNGKPSTRTMSNLVRFFSEGQMPKRSVPTTVRLCSSGILVLGTKVQRLALPLHSNVLMEAARQIYSAMMIDEIQGTFASQNFK